MTEGPRFIRVIGARQHNLKNVSVDIPRERLVTITGISGSGKSSLAFDTIFAEGQRRYVESLSAYARQFLAQLEKPDVDKIEGLSPAISIDQKSASHNPRSTVATVTEVYDYLRVLWARIGEIYCPDCGVRVAKQSIEQMVEAVMALPAGTRARILAPVVRGRKGTYEALFKELLRQGFTRGEVDGQEVDFSELAGSGRSLARYEAHDIDVVVDRLRVRPDGRRRVTESMETAARLSKGLVYVDVLGEEDGPKERLVFSEELACPRCGASFEEISPRTFSFNSPYGACEACHGLGVSWEVDPALVVPDDSLSLAEGAILPWAGSPTDYYMSLLKAVADSKGIAFDKPFRSLSPRAKRIILYGLGDEVVRVRFRSRRYGTMRERFTDYPGVIPWIKRRYEEADSEGQREIFRSYMAEVPCGVCQGTRLRKLARSVRIRGLALTELVSMPVAKALQWVESLELTPKEEAIGAGVLREVRARLGFLADVGLDYLTLDRASATLAGGEAQRIRLASQIGSQLSGVLYVLDEPSIGLHPRDNSRLIRTLKQLRDLGNTVIVVEHDEETIRSSDWVIDIGPGAGCSGGRVVAVGTPEEVAANEASLTGAYLSGRRRIELPQARRRPTGKALVVQGARLNNLKGIDVSFPLGLFVAVTGVSGSGKSTLVMDVLLKGLVRELRRQRGSRAGYDAIRGVEHVDRVVEVDQSPIGRTPRSNPATYTGAFTPIRELYARLEESRVRGYAPGRFSFNVKGGRCEACQGEGAIRVEMHFLPDVYVTCDACGGRRFNRDTLAITYRGKNIAEVLEMSVEEAMAHFEGHRRILRYLETLAAVGLSYVKLGQPAPTLSGGEAQRVKLATELVKGGSGHTVYILDEPTTGLHFYDVDKLLSVLNALVDKGNTVIVIEHNLDVVKCADWVIDLGPEGGDAGGTVVAEGPPEEIAACPSSYTGTYLKRYL